MQISYPLCVFPPKKVLFPTCQVRGVRFYQSACPPPLPPFPPPPPPRLAVLLALLLASASSTSTSALLHLHFRLANLANSLPSSSPTAQLSAHCWMSTCELPSSVCTAGPQPASCPAQLSVHRWTSTCELPSSVCTAGPQRTDRMPEDMPDRMPEGTPDRMPDKMTDRFANNKMYKCYGGDHTK